MVQSPPRWVRALRLVFAAVALLAIIVQARQSFANGFPPANFFSFFTIQSNLFAVAVLFWTVAARGASQPSVRRDLVRGAAVLYLSITGVVYGVLLAGYQQELQTTIPWVDTVLHKIIPLVMLMDWLIEPPAHRLSFRRAFVWLAYPVVYVTYSLLRGPLVGWYPYPFLNPAQPGGYAAVAAYSVGIAAFSLLLTWLLVTIGKHARLVVA